MNECTRLILVAREGTTPDRVTCSLPEGHTGSHLGTLTDGRRCEWTVPRGALAARVRFV